MNTSHRQIPPSPSLALVTLLLVAGCHNPADDVAGAKVAPGATQTANYPKDLAFNGSSQRLDSPTYQLRDLQDRIRGLEGDGRPQRRFQVV